MGVPAGQHARFLGSTTAFSAFSVGDVVLVSDTDDNNGVYTVNTITTDGSHSYMGLSGPTLTQETDQVDVNIRPISLGGNKLICLGDEDLGIIKVWSYNESSTEDDGTILSSPSIGTSGWSCNAITPVINGSNSHFLFTAGQSAVRVCDTNIANNSIIKHFSYINRFQFGHRKGGHFANFEEHINTLPKPVAGGLVSHAYTVKEAYGVNENDATGVTPDFHLRRSLNDISSPGYAKTDIASCRLDVAGKDVAVGSEYFKLEDPSDLAKVPFDGVIGLADENGLVDHETTFENERMLVRHIDPEKLQMQVYRGYGNTPHETAAITPADSPYLVQYGCGWNFKVTQSTTEGSYGGSGDTLYEFAQSFIYDGNQESLLRTTKNMQTVSTNNLTLTENMKALNIFVYAFGPYSGRVTGGRIYIREYQASETWSLLVDIDIEKGCRTVMDGEYQNWADASALDSGQVPNGCFHSGTVALISKGEQADKYADMNNYYPDISRNSIGAPGENYAAATTGGERAWVGNVKIMQPSGGIERFGDRIVYSEFGKYDTFPTDVNWFTASKGDAEDITALEYFGDRLLIFKSRTLHIWNVASGEPQNWVPERTVQFGGVTYQHSIASTPYGIAWANLNGCYFYDGQQVSDLTEGKIRDSQNSYHGANIPPNWEDFTQSSTYEVRPMVIYSPKEKQLYIMRDPAGGSNTNRCFIYNFLTRSWVFNTSIFSTGVEYTNPVIDWNGNPVVAYEIENDTAANLASAFNKDELISVNADSDMDDAGACNWTEYSPDGTAPTFIKDNVGGGGTDNKLHIEGTASVTNKEGAQLDVGEFQTMVVSKTYRVTCKLVSATDMAVPFYIGLGTNISSIGQITTDETTYSADITCANVSGDLFIYKIGNGEPAGAGTDRADGAVAWTIDDVSIKEISLQATVDLSSLLSVGDTLKVHSEYFTVTVLNGAFITVDTAQAGSTAANHATADSDIYVKKAQFQQLSGASIATASPRFITKDIDFDQPALVKKVYKIYITYMNSASGHLVNRIEVAADGNTTFEQTSITTPHSSSTFALTGTLSGSKSSWDVAVFTFDKPFPCQSIALYFNPDGIANGISINDISFEYKIIHKRVS